MVGQLTIIESQAHHRPIALEGQVRIPEQRQDVHPDLGPNQLAAVLPEERHRPLAHFRPDPHARLILGKRLTQQSQPIQVIPLGHGMLQVDQLQRKPLALFQSLDRGEKNTQGQIRVQQGRISSHIRSFFITYRKTKIKENPFPAIPSTKRFHRSRQGNAPIST